MEKTFEIETLQAVVGTGSWERVQHRLQAFESTAEALKVAGREGLRGPLARALVERNCGDERVRAAAHEEVFWNAQYIDLLQELDAALAARGRTGIVFKGASLILTTYAGKMGMRALSDIDLYLQPEAMNATVEILEEMDFNRRGDQAYGFHRGGLFLDLHTEINNRIEGAFDFSPEVVFGNSRPLPGYEAVRILGPEDQWLQLAVHATKHAFRRWVWLLDLALLWPEVNREKLIERARQLRARRVTTYSAILLRDVVGMPGPPEMVSLNRVEKKFLEQIKRRRASESFGKFIPFFSIPSPWGKIRYILRFFGPQHPGQSQRERLVQLLRLFRGLFRRGRS